MALEWYVLLVLGLCCMLVSCEIKPIPEFIDFSGGSLNSQLVDAIADRFEGQYSQDLHWLASSCEFFSFNTSDGLVLQGFYIKSALELAEKAIAELKEIIVFSAGFSESIVKYAHFLREMHRRGHSIYSYDLRGQGFSESQKVRDPKGRMAHLSKSSTFDDTYIADLEYFMYNYVMTDKSSRLKGVVYMGNSLSGLIGVAYSSKHPQSFSKLILFAPLLGMVTSPPVNTILKFVRYFIPTKILATRFKDDIEGALITHDSNSFENWKKFRDLMPELFYFQGPSLGWVAYIVDAVDSVASMASKIESSVLIIQASVDSFVRNEAITNALRYFSKPEILKFVKIKDSYHELLHETPATMAQIFTEIDLFLSKSMDLETSRSLFTKSFQDVRATEQIDSSTDAVEPTNESNVEETSILSSEL